MKKQTNFKLVLKNKFRFFYKFFNQSDFFDESHKQKNKTPCGWLDNNLIFEIVSSSKGPPITWVSRTSKIYAPFIGSAAVCVPISRNLK